MRLYSDKLTRADVERAFAEACQIDGADIYPDGIRQFRARRTLHRNGVEFYAYSLHGSRATGHRVIGSYPLNGERRAASWDAWGWVIARLFHLDPDAVIGNYAGLGDFVRQVESASRREPKDFLCLVS